jgi:hypothetical protein
LGKKETLGSGIPKDPRGGCRPYGDGGGASNIGGASP